MAEAAVKSFLVAAGAAELQHDGDIVEYLQGFVEACSDVEELVEVIESFVPEFEAVSKAQQRELVQALLRRVAGEDAAPADDAEHTPVQAPEEPNVAEAVADDVDEQDDADDSSSGELEEAKVAASPLPKQKEKPQSDGTANQQDRAPARSNPNSTPGKGKGSIKLKVVKWLKPSETLQEAIMHLFVSHGAEHVDESVRDYVHGFLVDEHEVPTLQSLLDIVSMLPGCEELPASHTDNICQSMLLLRKHHFERERVRATQAKQQRKQRKKKGKKPQPQTRGHTPARKPESKEPAAQVAAPGRAKGKAVPVDPAKVEQLAMLDPSFPAEFIPDMLRRCNGNVEAVADLIFEPGFAEREATRRRRAAQAREEMEEQAALAAKLQEEARRSVVDRYAEEVDTSYKTYKPLPVLSTRTRKAMRKEHRYYENRVVSTKGEKYFVYSQKQEDPSTFISLKIKTKGKRGPGYR